MGVAAIIAGVIAAIAYFGFHFSSLSASFAEVSGQALLMFLAMTGAVGGGELVYFLMSAEAKNSPALTNRHFPLNIGAGAVLVLSVGGLIWPFLPRADAFELRDRSGHMIVAAYADTTQENQRHCREVEAALEAASQESGYYCVGRAR